MLQIVRAEDGELFQVDTSIWDIERSGNLEYFLHEQTGVEEEAILAYLSDGTRLTSQNIQELAGSHDDTIFVYNKLYLNYDLDEVLKELRAKPRLQPPIEDAISSTPPFRPSQLAAAYLQAAHYHQDVINHLADSILLQHDALGISSQTLDLHLLSLSDTYDSFTQIAGRELEKQSVLLASLSTDLRAIRGIQVHSDFLSQKTRAAGEIRTLGAWVDENKMKQVGESCTSIHETLRLRFKQAQECMGRLKDGADKVRLVMQETHVKEDAVSSRRRAQDAVERITDFASRLEGPHANSEVPLQELKQTDARLRQEVEAITDLKNESTEVCVNALRDISMLNNDLMQLPILMGSLQTDLRAKTSFSHIQRLHNMPYAYGATIIEIVRRKEFANFFYRRAQNILEVMAKLSSSEKKRRQIYRGEVHGQLPFDPRIPEEPVPSITDFSTTGGKYSEYAIERKDIEAFMQAFAALERDLWVSANGSIEPYQETRKALEKLFDRMDGLELTFDRIVERSLLSSSMLSSSRRRTLAIEESAVQDLSEKAAALEREKGELEAILIDDRTRYESEIAQLKAEVQKSEVLEREVHSLKSQNESESQARRILEQRHSELQADLDNLRAGQAEALGDATTQAKEADALRQELARTRAEYEEIKQLETKNSQKIAQLIEDQTTTLRNLEEARLRGEDLQSQIQGARTENDEVNRALKDARDQKDRLLRAQALEHERLMRDHIAEADGDRAVLEQQYFEAKALLDQNERQLKQAKSEIDILHADNAGLREELQRTEHALREARHVERVLRNDLSEGRASQSDYEQKIAERDRLVAQILDVAIAFRDSHSKAFAALQPLSIHPATVLKNGTNPSESVVLSPPRLPMSPLREESTPIDPTDPTAALEILRSYDLDAFSETVSKVGSVSRRWQKQCKEYRERAKGKITFRNFAKGDLALFLPTRNSVSKPWAAFNVSFPHYFLNATGRLADQLKTREWIVARITSITERVVDVRDPSTNPYGLGDGVKYFLLEVEDWTRPGSDGYKRRKSTGQRGQDRAASPPLLERPISPPLPDDRQTNTSAAEPLGPTRSPNSHLFPVRTRSNSNPAGPSSLSRLLAQAPTENSLETIPASPSPTRSRTPSPSTRGAPAPPSPTRNVVYAHSPSVSSPLRPGSRASGSSSSRLSFSGGRIAPFPRGSSSSQPGISKAAPTTALSSELPVASPPASSSNSSRAIANGSFNDSDAESRMKSPNRIVSTPSPTQSVGDGLANVFAGRRRTTSEHIPATSSSPESRHSVVGSPTTATSTLANLVGMTMSLGRRKRIESGKLNVNNARTAQSSSTSSITPTPTPGPTAPSASPSFAVAELLKRF